MRIVQEILKYNDLAKLNRIFLKDTRTCQQP